MTDLILQKHNSVTDGITDLTLPAEKILNAIYHTWEDKKAVDKNITTFKISIPDLKKLVGYDSNDDILFLDCIRELRKELQFRNFDYDGKVVKYMSSSFLSNVTIYKDDCNMADITIDPRTVLALKQRAGYTALDLKIVEKFTTKYGYKLYQFSRRYWTLPNSKENRINQDIGNIEKNIDELNIILGSNAKYISELERIVKRAMGEIISITGENIHYFVKNANKEKTFSFSWGRTDPRYETIEKFKSYIRKNHINKSLIINSNGEEIRVTSKGLLYIHNKENQPTLTTKDANKIWEHLYTLARNDKLYTLKQKELNFT